MTIGANSYSSASDVAALVPRYTASGIFSTSTQPTLAQVERWIDQVSATINVALAQEGFSIPVTNSDAQAAISAVIAEAVADLCHAANSSGRFFTERALERGAAPMKVIRSEMLAWVSDMASGLALLGATRSRDGLSGVLYRDGDESGNDVTPLFERKAYGDATQEWDTEG